MTDHAINAIRTARLPGPRGAWASFARVTLEFALLFGVAIALDRVILIDANGPYPNPLWLPVILLSLEHGLGVAVAAALTSSALYASFDLPPALVTEDLYTYLGRGAAEPVGWTCAALLIGHLRTRQIGQVAELQEEVIEGSKHSAAVAELCASLKSRTEMLERHIAANANTSAIDIAEAITGLHDASFDNFADRLTRFIVLMVGSSEFSIYMLRGNTLRLAFQPPDETRHPSDLVVEPDDALFAAVVHHRRILAVTRPEDRKLLGDRGVLMGPLLENSASNRVIGMLGIGGADLIDFPDDIERRFRLTCAEISRLLSRVILVDSWQTPPVRAIEFQQGPFREAAAEPRPFPAAPPIIDSTPGPAAPAPTAEVA
jgi:hypothetical protein